MSYRAQSSGALMDEDETHGPRSSDAVSPLDLDMVTTRG